MEQFLEYLNNTNMAMTSSGFPDILSIIWAVIILFIGRWLARRARGWFIIAVQNTTAHSNRRLVYAVERIIYYGILIIALSLALVSLGMPLYSLMTIFVIILLFIAIALQTSLNNFAATIIFLVFQTLKPGDWVDVLNGTFGQVKEIQMFSTVIVTQEKSTVTVPNGVIMQGNIINYSELGYRRADMLVTIKYQADLLQAKTIMEQILAENKHVLAEPAPVIGVVYLGDKGVDFSLRPFALVEDYWTTIFEITEQVKLKLNEAGIEVPVFQQDIHVIQTDALK